MKKAAAYLLVLSVVLSCMIGCSMRRPRVIPRDTLSEIFADMFLADQWLVDNGGERRRADTMLFYEPIFRKYGYDSLDYYRTIDEYIYEPDKFLKIINATSEILDGKLKQKEAVKAVIEKIKEANAQIKGYRFRDFSTDSLRWADSVVLWHRYALDSLCRDSLCRDSLCVADTLQAEDLVRSDIGTVEEMEIEEEPID